MATYKKPDFFPRHIVQRLRQDLVSAQKNIDEYEELIASLYTALQNIQNNVCADCRVNVEKFAPPNLPTSPTPASSAGESSNSVPLWRRILRGHLGALLPPPIRPNKPSSQPANPAPPRVAPSLPVIKVTAVATPIRTTCSLSKLIRTPSASNPTLSLSETARGQPNKSDWPVEYNRKVKSAVTVKVEHVMEHDAKVRGMRFSPDGNYLGFGLGQGDGRTYVYAVKTGEKVCVLEDISAKREQGAWCLCFSPDGKYLATGYEGQIRVWEIAKRYVRNMFREHKKELFDIDFSPDGRCLVSSSYDQTVRISNMRGGSSKILADGFYCRKVRFSQDGRYIAGSDYDGTVRIWSVRTGQLVEKWTAHEGGAWGMALMPDEKGLVTSGQDGTLKYWHVNFLELAGPRGGMTKTSGKREILKFTGHSGSVWWVAVSPDGRWVISGGADRSMRIWSSLDASLQCTLQGHTKDICSVHFSPIGNYLASGGDDGRVTLWTYEAA